MLTFTVLYFRKHPISVNFLIGCAKLNLILWVYIICFLSGFFIFADKYIIFARLDGLISNKLTREQSFCHILFDMFTEALSTHKLSTCET